LLDRAYAYLGHCFPVFPSFARFHRLAEAVPTSRNPKPRAKKQWQGGLNTVLPVGLTPGVGNAWQFSVSASTLYYALMAFATAGRNFYVAVPLNMFMMTGYAAMQSMLMLEGSKTGMAQGTSEYKTPTPLGMFVQLARESFLQV